MDTQDNTARYPVWKPDSRFPCYRIPAIVKAASGKLLAFCEARASTADVHDCVLVMKTSMDHGKTWSDQAIVWDDRPASIVNPTVMRVELPVGDTPSGRIILFVQRYPGNIREHGAKPGLEGPACTQNFMMTSDDEGQSWSKPANITKSTKRVTYYEPKEEEELDVTTNAFGPGVAIQKQYEPHEGRIIVPVNQGPWNMWRNYMIYSDDGGASWTMGDLIPEVLDDLDQIMPVGGNEVQVVERSDGTLLLNARHYKGMLTGPSGEGFRVRAVSTDGGESWSPLVEDKGLPEPGCQGSILRGPDLGGGTPSILFSNPGSQTARKFGVVRASTDEGETWPMHVDIEPEFFGYSCLVLCNDGTIGVLAEHGEKTSIDRIAFYKVKIERLVI